MKSMPPTRYEAEGFNRLYALAPAETASAGKRWRFHRNVVIFVAALNGVSRSILADVFDLPKSRISAIIREFSDTPQSI